MKTRAKTNDDGKEPLAHLPWAAIDEMSRVQHYGFVKYGSFADYRKGMEVSRQSSCALRHIRDFLRGKNKDHESGLHPLAHAITRLAFIIQNQHEGTAIDDRFVLPVKRKKKKVRRRAVRIKPALTTFEKSKK